jgi:putative Holliday junction resolvase
MKTHNILSIDKFKTNIGRKSRLLGIDNGKKNVGIAICDENQIVATPFRTIRKNKFENLIDEIKRIIDDNMIKGIIVGNPINMDGSIGKSSQSASDFCINLSKNITVPIAMWDERLSSSASHEITKELGVNTSSRVKNLDKNAAAFILQGAIDFLSN